MGHGGVPRWGAAIEKLNSAIEATSDEGNSVMYDPDREVGRAAKMKLPLSFFFIHLPLLCFYRWMSGSTKLLLATSSYLCVRCITKAAINVIAICRYLVPDSANLALLPSYRTDKFHQQSAAFE